MKIAILSMQRVVNYGSVLQAYSLREMIREIQGDIPVFLDIEDAPALKSRMTVTEMAEDYADRKQMSDGILMRGKRWLTVRLSRYNKRLIRAFMEKELHLDSLNSGRQYDAVVIGSDEVFNHAKGVRLQLHGDVRQAERVITYAASCGSAKADDISADDLPRLRTAVDRIEGMSVRDNGTEAYLSDIYSKPVIRHMDPVLMGPLYRRSVRPVAVRRYLLVYAYGHRIHKREEIEAIQAYARENGLKLIRVCEEGIARYTAPLVRLAEEKAICSAELARQDFRTMPEDWPWWTVPEVEQVKAEIQADPRWNEWVERSQEHFQ